MYRFCMFWWDKAPADYDSNACWLCHPFFYSHLLEGVVVSPKLEVQFCMARWLQLLVVAGYCEGLQCCWRSPVVRLIDLNVFTVWTRDDSPTVNPRTERRRMWKIEEGMCWHSVSGCGLLSVQKEWLLSMCRHVASEYEGLLTQQRGELFLAIS